MYAVAARLSDIVGQDEHFEQHGKKRGEDDGQEQKRHLLPFFRHFLFSVSSKQTLVGVAVFFSRAHSRHRFRASRAFCKRHTPARSRFILFFSLLTFVSHRVKYYS